MKKKILALFLMTVCSVSFAVFAPVFPCAQTYAASVYDNEELSAFAYEVASAVNRERAANGCAPLVFAEKLNRAAVVRSREIQTRFDHVRPDETGCFTALEDEDIDYYCAGENIAYGQKTPERVISAWMNSEGHRANILDKDFEYLGVGVTYANGVYYWTQLFAASDDLTGDVIAAVTSQPKDVTLCAGERAVFTVGAVGDRLKYQWYYQKSGMTGWNRWNGHTDAITSGTANATWNGMQVFCTVTDSTGFTTSSQAATITVQPTPIITAHPRSIILREGQKASFSVAAKGSSLRYQWYYKKKGASIWSKWNGHTDASTEAVANITWNDMQVRCEVRESDGNYVFSNPSVITIDTSPIITAHPVNITLHTGDVASFSVKAAGTGLKYQWYYKKAGASGWSKWNGHTAANTNAFANATWNGMQVRCQLKDSYGNTVYTNAASVKVIPKPVITVHPENVTVKSGQKAVFSVKATGEGLTYQWYYKKADANVWKKWSTHNTATTYSVANDTWDEMKVYCVVTDVTGKTASSDYAMVYIH